MDVVDLEQFRNRKVTDETEDRLSPDDLSLVEYDEDADMSDIVFLTSERDGVVVIFNPLTKAGAFLTPDQAQELGMQIIQYATMARYREVLMEKGETE